LKDIRVFAHDRLTPQGVRDRVGNRGAPHALGLAGFVAGVMWRNYAETSWRKCKQRVVARKGGSGLRCPVDDYCHYATLRALPVMLFTLVAVFTLGPLLAFIFGDAKFS
jgi:hypothetical protein